MDRIEFVDRELTRLTFIEEHGPAKTKEKMVYNVKLSDPKSDGKGNVSIMVEAVLFAAREGGDDVAVKPPFLTLEMELKFKVEKGSGKKSPPLTNKTPKFVTYAFNLAAEVISPLLMHTKYRIHSFPR